MDKLTLIAIAQATPWAALQDGDNDRWHACCVLKWIETRTFRRYGELLGELRPANGCGVCYHCNGEVKPDGAIWMP